jgi:Halocarboxylic acid dehydrogenase DehI
MFGLRRPKQIEEHEAAGEIERIYHEIRETLRVTGVTGVNLNFRIWARYEKFLPTMWEAVRPNVETCLFENAADQLRAEAVYIAERWARPSIPCACR